MTDLMARAEAAVAARRAEQEAFQKAREARNRAESLEAVGQLLGEYLEVTKYKEVQTFDLPVLVEVDSLLFTAVRNEYEWMKRPWLLHLADRCERCNRDMVIGHDIRDLLDLGDVLEWRLYHAPVCDACREYERKREAKNHPQPRICPLRATSEYTGESCKQERCAWWTVDPAFGNGCALRSLAIYAQAAAKLLADRKTEEPQKELEPNRVTG